MDVVERFLESVPVLTEDVVPEGPFVVAHVGAPLAVGQRDSRLVAECPQFRAGRKPATLVGAVVARVAIPCGVGRSATSMQAPVKGIVPEGQLGPALRETEDSLVRQFAPASWSMTRRRPLLPSTQACISPSSESGMAATAIVPAIAMPASRPSAAPMKKRVCRVSVALMMCSPAEGKTKSRYLSAMSERVVNGYRPPESCRLAKSP